MSQQHQNMKFDEFDTAALRVEHITHCETKLAHITSKETSQTQEGLVQIFVESYLSNEDGSFVERGRAIFEMSPRQFDALPKPGAWLLQSFERAIADKFQGFTRYATAGEIAEHDAATQPAAQRVGSGCWCETCDTAANGLRTKMALCPQCGNKRCPRATHHDNSCTGSNEPGQKGSSWGHVIAAQAKEGGAA